MTSDHGPRETPDHRPLESRLPIGQSPRWITVYTFGGLGASIAAMLLYGLPDSARPTVRWIHAVVPVLALAALARAYAPRRRVLTPVETGVPPGRDHPARGGA